MFGGTFTLGGTLTSFPSSYIMAEVKVTLLGWHEELLVEVRLHSGLLNPSPELHLPECGIFNINGKPVGSIISYVMASLMQQKEDSFQEIFEKV